jgi:hypothetical protein
LGAVGGDRKAGYLRLDDARMPRLQVKWSSGSIDLERKRAEYVKRLTVGKRKRPTGLEVDTEADVLSKRAKPKKDIATFAWRGPQCGMGVLWNCEVCRRGLIAQVSWPVEEDGRETAQSVLESLEDHGIQGWDTWAVDGLAFLAPTTFDLVGWRRMTRYLELRLSQQRERLKVARWGMVPLVLRGRSVEEWYERENSRRRDVVWRAQQATIKGHEGVAARGLRRGVLAGLRRNGRRLLRRPPGEEFAAQAWHCPTSNRLHLVETVGGEGEVLQGVVDSVICHQEM